MKQIERFAVDNLNCTVINDVCDVWRDVRSFLMAISLRSRRPHDHRNVQMHNNVQRSETYEPICRAMFI